MFKIIILTHNAYNNNVFNPLPQLYHKKSNTNTLQTIKKNKSIKQISKILTLLNIRYQKINNSNNIKLQVHFLKDTPL